jgi:hypothetical protein
VNVSSHQYRPAHSSLFELESAVRTAEQADYVEIAARGGEHEALERVLRNAARAAGPVVARAARRRTELGSGYDVAFVTVMSFRDLWLLAGLDLRSVAERRICLVLELWTPEIHHFDLFRDVLEQFDAVYNVMESSCPALAAAIKSPVHFLPTGTDTALHCPPAIVPRQLDVLSLGRRCPVQHAELVDAARRGRVSYQFDSLRGASLDDWSEHRLNIAGQGQRATFYIAHRAKFDVPWESEQCEDFGNRFFDAGAAGSIPLGEIPTTAGFRSYFPAVDDMVRVPTGTSGIVKALLAYLEDADRCLAVSRGLVVDALRRHDWLHRWTTMLGGVGLEPSTAAVRRIDQLARLASAVESGDDYVELREQLTTEPWGMPE